MGAIKEEISKMKSNIRKRLKVFDKHKEELGKYTTTIVAKMKELTKKNIRYMDYGDLIDYYRNLSYIYGLKSATYRGSRVAEAFINRAKELGSISDEYEDMYWNIFNNLVEEYGLVDKLKYEISALVKNDVMIGMSSDSIYYHAASMIADYNEEQEKQRAEVFGEDFYISF